MIPAECPWIGCTPDGVVLKDGVPTVLLKIKCPVKGKKESADIVVDSCKFIEKCQSEQNYRLKKSTRIMRKYRCAWLCLILQNVILLFSSSFDNSFINIKVSYDHDYAWKMVTHLKSVYFKHILPVLSSSL